MTRLPYRSAAYLAPLALFFAWLIFCWHWLSGHDVIPFDSKFTYFQLTSWAVDCYRQGHLPLWDPYFMSGFPGCADPQIHCFYPFATPLLALLGPLQPRTYDFFEFIHLLAAGLGIYFLSRACKVSAAPSAVAALITLFGGSASARLQHTGMIYAYGLLPWCLLFVKITIERKNFLYALGLGVFAGSMAILGDQVAYLNCLTVGGFASVLIGRKAKEGKSVKAPMLRLISAFILTLIVMLPQMIPTAELLPLSSRPWIPLQNLGPKSLYAWSFLTMLVPNIFRTFDGFANYVGSNDPCETYLYIGLIPITILIYGGICKKLLFLKQNLGLTVSLFFLTLYALGTQTPAYACFWTLIPGVKAFQRPTDATFLINIFLALLTGKILDQLRPDHLPSNSPNKSPNNQPSNLSKNLPSNLSRNLPSNLSSNLSRNLPNALPNDLPNNLSNKLSNNLSNDLPHALPNDLSTNLKAFPRGRNSIYATALTASCIAVIFALARICAPNQPWQVHLGAFLKLALFLFIGFWLLQRIENTANRVFRNLLIAILALISFFDLQLTNSSNLLNTAPQADYAYCNPSKVADFPALSILAKLKSSEEEPFRVETLGSDEERDWWNTANHLKVQVTDGMWPINLLSYHQYAGACNPVFGRRFNHWMSGFDSPLFDLLNVKYVLTNLTEAKTVSILNPAKFKLIDSLDRYSVYQNLKCGDRAFLVGQYKICHSSTELGNLLGSKTFDTFSQVALLSQDFERREGLADLSRLSQLKYPLSVEDTVNWIDYKDNFLKMSVNCQDNRLLVITDIYFPGWNAYVDGTSTNIYRADYLFRAILLSKGKHVVCFRYEPYSIKALKESLRLAKQ